MITWDERNAVQQLTIGYECHYRPGCRQQIWPPARPSTPRSCLKPAVPWPSPLPAPKVFLRPAHSARHNLQAGQGGAAAAQLAGSRQACCCYTCASTIPQPARRAAAPRQRTAVSAWQPGSAQERTHASKARPARQLTHRAQHQHSDGGLENPLPQREPRVQQALRQGRWSRALRRCAGQPRLWDPAVTLRRPALRRQAAARWAARCRQQPRRGIQQV